MGISPGARAASPPLRGLSLAEDPFTRAVERASPCAGHARWETPPIMGPPHFDVEPRTTQRGEGGTMSR